jgi:hypothetical protein
MTNAGRYAGGDAWFGRDDTVSVPVWVLGVT